MKCTFKHFPLIIAVIFFGISLDGQCQDVSLLDDYNPADSTFYRIVTTDGNEFLGTILSVSQEFIEFQSTALGKIQITIKSIKSIEEINLNKVIEGQLWFDNPQSTRYFFAPNAYGPSKESYYQNVWVLFNQFVIGVSDNVTVGAGILPLFLFAGANSPLWFTPRISLPIEKDRMGLAAGGLFGTVLGVDQSGFGILYGITTFGDRDSNISIGLGYGYAGGDFANSPTITFSGMFRTGAKGYFITENYYIGSAGEDVILISLGGRRIINRVGIDFGGFLPVSELDQGFVMIPWLGITVPFAKNLQNRSQ